MLKLFPFFLAIALTFTACHQTTHEKESTTVFSGSVMTLSYHIIIGKSLNANEKQAVMHLIQKTFDEANAIYNKWNPDSELSQLNRLKAGEIHLLSPELELCLSHAQKIVEISHGRFDPTIEPLQNLWKIHLEKGETPNEEDKKKFAEAVGWNKIHFSHGQFSKDNDLTSLDLGGIAKGLIVDILTDRLKASGYMNVFVEWGGEIFALGEHPDKREWNIFISRLGDSNPKHAIAHLKLKNQAIATSGDYQQFWTIEQADKKITYFHVIDPRTLSPLISKEGSITSASVLASQCWFADGLATTALMFDSIEEAEAWAKNIQQQFPETAFWLISNEN
jgi:thiamine biosynthesis lipoprotein